MTPAMGEVGCGKYCGCCASNIPKYTNTFAPNPPVSESGVLLISTQAQQVQYVYNQGPPIVVPCVP